MLEKFRKNLSRWVGKLFSTKMNALLKGPEKNFEKKLSLLTGKFSLGKKSALLNGVWLRVKKYTKSFGGKNLAFCKWFLPVKKQSLFLISNQTLFKSAEFFPFRQSYLVKK